MLRRPGGRRAPAPHPLLDDAVRFVADRLLADGPHLKPAYTIDRRSVPDERQLDLPGYPGGTDIVGNWVNQQFQLDAFGEALLLFAAAAGHDHLDADGWRAAETAAAAIEQRWHEPDAGIWEIDPDALDAQPADLRRRAARDRRRAARRRAGRPLARARRRDRRRHRRARAASRRRAGSARPATAPRRRAAAAGAPRRVPRRRPALVATLRRRRRAN